MRGGLAALLAQAMIAAAAPADVLEYVYIEANAGSSAGGHAALRLGDDVFDFQNHRFDTLRLRRTRWDEFRYLYTVLENRTLRIARIETSDPVAEAIRDRFNRRFLEEGRRFAHLAELRRDRQLLERLAAASPASVTDISALLDLRGAGLFYGSEVGSGESAVLSELRVRIAAKHGAGFLDARRRDLESEISALASQAGFAGRFSELSLQLLALRTVDAALAVRPERLRSTNDGSLALDARERERLARLSEGLESALVDLVASRRPDWGYPALLGMARLEAIATSLREDRLVVLDAYAATPRASTGTPVRSSAYLSELLENAERDLAWARARLANSKRPGELTVARLEDAVNRFVETREAARDGRPLRLREEPGLPAPRPEEVTLPLPANEPARFAEAAREAQERERTALATLRNALGYDLVTRNCITEIFATLDAELGAQGSERALGGRLEPSRSLDFIPVVSYGSVVETYRVTEVGEIPSLRRTRMAELYEEENDFRVYLRESNTLSSTIYRRNDMEPFFLFFTDDAIAPRPLFGALNVAAGAAQAAVGVLRAPFDRGATLWSGIKGIAFSLPELFFVNLRKGILEYAPADPPRTVAHFRPHPPQH
jgi:hypothetical protein